MKRYYLFALLLLCSAGTAAAQITITEADVRNYFGASATTVTTHTAEDASSLQALAGATGANQTWDFRGATYTSDEFETGQRVNPPVPGSDDPDFASANHIFMSGGKDAAGRDSVTYVFTRLDGQGWTLLGMVARGEFDEETAGIETWKIKYTPGLLQFKLPLTFGTEWTSETAFVVDVEELPFEQDISESTTCDGWGRIVVPEGSFDAIRCRNETTTTMTIPGFPPITSTSTSIEFVTKTAVGASLDLDDAGNVLFASYTTASGGGGTAVDPGEVPGPFALEQNYPNPFNPSTVIPFSLSESGHVTLRVFNALGQEVATLVDGFRPAGSYQVAWNAAGLPSGPYLYQMNLNGQLQSRTLVLQK